MTPLKTSDLTRLTRQEAKEMACRLGIQRGYAIIRRGNDTLWRAYPDKTTFLCRSENPHALWHSAIEMIHYEDSLRKESPRPAPWMRVTASIIHNAVIHPIMPFVWGRAARFVDTLHDITADIAYRD